MTAISHTDIPTDMIEKTLDPSGVPADKLKFYERVRRTIVAKSIFGMLKPTAMTAIMHQKIIAGIQILM